MDNFLIDNVIEKVEDQGKRLEQTEKVIAEMDGKVSGISDQTSNLKKLTGLVVQVQERMTQIVWPVEKINELSLRLKVNNDLLSSPVKTKQTVVHTAGKLGWVITFLFLIVVSLALGLFEMAGRLDRYKTNDLLWRYIKVTNNDQNLEYLQLVEKLHFKDPEKMKSLVESEEFRQKQILEARSVNQIQNQTDTASSPTRAIQKRKRRK